MENKEPIIERIYAFLDSLPHYNEQLHNFGVWLYRILRIVAVILVSINALYLIQNNRYITIWNTIPLFSKISKFEFLLLVSGFLSSIFLFFFVLSILGKIIRLTMRIISNGYNIIIIEPSRKLFIWVIQGIKQSRLWKYSYDLGEMVGYQYVLYPALSRLEPALDRQNITSQTLEVLPPEAYSDEHLSEDVQQRYTGFGDNLLILILLVSFFGILILSLPLGVITRFFVIIASLLPSFLGNPITSLINIANNILPFIILLSWYAFLSGCFAPYAKRRHAWVLCQYQLHRKRELEEQASEIDDGIGQQLQTSIEKIVQLYKKESQKTQEAKLEFEKATNQLWHLVEQPGMDEETLKSVYGLVEWSMDKRRKEDAIIRERENREGRISDIVIGLVTGSVTGFVISAFFFMLSVPK